VVKKVVNMAIDGIEFVFRMIGNGIRYFIDNFWTIMFKLASLLFGGVFGAGIGLGGSRTVTALDSIV